MEGQVQLSTNGGESWSGVFTSNQRLFSIEIDSLRPSRLYTAGGIHYNFSTDGGAVWYAANGPSSELVGCQNVAVHSETEYSIVYFASNDGVYEFYDPIVYNCGDANADGKVNSSDIIYIVNHVFKGGASPVPLTSMADANCSGSIAASDIIETVNVVFKSGQFSCSECPSEFQ